MTRGNPEHGTIAAFAQHVAKNEKPCDPCRSYAREYQAMYRAGLTKRKRCPSCLGGINKKENDLCNRCARRAGKRPECGTVLGYVWHTRTLREKPCDDCNEARNRKRSGTKPKQCINPGCVRRVYIRAQDYCGECRRHSIVGWMTHKGIKKPIYHLKGRYENAHKSG